MKCKTCNQPVLYFGCKWMGIKKNYEKVFWYCFDCGLTVTRHQLHNTIKKCYAKGEAIRGLIVTRERRVEYLWSMDFGDSIRSLDRERIIKYAYVIARLYQKSHHPPTIQLINKVLFQWGMKPLEIGDLNPKVRVTFHPLVVDLYHKKIQEFLGTTLGGGAVEDINEVDWFDQEIEEKCKKGEEEDAMRKKYFNSLIIPKEYRERWANNREEVMKELDVKKIPKNKGFLKAGRPKKVKE